MPQDKELFREALIGKKIPILVLDHQWHKLFTQAGDHEGIRELENKLNDLLKSQGRLNTELKTLNSYKREVMDEIMKLMEVDDSPEKDKKMDERKQIIENTNTKIDAINDELLDLPRLIDDTNFELMLATMELCYEKIKKNSQDIDDINQWVQDFRNELKRKAILKQKKQIWNNELYSYMHDIFGPEVIGVFDMKYNPNHVFQKEESSETKDTKNE